jgi:muramoyltetrapeptide carboxypeptidase
VVEPLTIGKYPAGGGVGKTLENVLEDRLGGLGIPVLYGLNLGHGASLATLPLGVEATVDADALTLTIDEPALLNP